MTHSGTAAVPALAAVRKVLQLLQDTLGFSSICLFADKDKPHIGAMYQVGRSSTGPGVGLGMCVGGCLGPP